MKQIKKLIIAVLATLMLAGALSAFSSAISITSVATIPLLGEGASPCPGALSSAPDDDSASLNKRF